MPHVSRIHVRFAIVVVAALLLVVPVLRASTQTDAVHTAWQHVQAAGSYHFAGDVTQVTTPSATVTNIGRASREDTLHLEGEADLRHHRMTLRLWTRGGSVAQPDSGVEVEVVDGKTRVRQSGGAWQESGDITGGLAPEGDFTSYLQAIRQITARPAQTRAGLTFTPYSFAVDGPAFAGYMRDQIEAAMRR